MIFAILIIVLALVFDLYNGMNDAANSIATVVSTRVLSPFQAVLWAAFFNFVAAFFFGVNVANTIGKGIVDVLVVDNFVIFSVITMWIVRYKSPYKVDKYFRKLQLVSAALYSLSHGANDAQKTMGIIA